MSERELLPVASGRRTLRSAGALLRPRVWTVVLALAVLLAGTLAGLLVPPLVGHIVDLVTGRRGAGSITWPAILLVAAALAQGALSAAGLAELARAGENALAELRERFLARALRLPLDQLERAGSGDLTSRVTGDVTVIAEAVRRALPALIGSLLTIVSTLAGMAVLDWRFLPAALVAVPVQLHTARWYSRRAGPLYAEQRAAAGAQQHALLGTIDGAATLRALRLTGRHLGRVERRSQAAVDMSLRGVALQTRFYTRLHVGEYAGLCAVLAVGFVLVRDGSATVGGATAAALYFHGLFGPINMALALVDDAQSAAAGLRRLVGVADLPTPAERNDADVPTERADVRTDGAAAAPADTAATLETGVGASGDAPRTPGDGIGTPEDPPRTPGDGIGTPEDPPRTPGDGIGTLRDASVTARALGHAYVPGRPVLSDVTLDVAAGERVALVGASGAGKTTLAKLIAGVHRPGTGSVLVGGHPPVPGAHVVLVTQEVHVFAGTLADDLRLAAPDARDAELCAALDRVGALGWAEGLPERLATRVGDGGHTLTVAEAQQLAFARLVLADPRVVILDEATAEAGSAGARVLEASAEAALEGRTALVVAHRLTQAAAADRVIVLDAGRIAETGTHAELLAAAGTYAALWSAWSQQRR
ncbi:ABC transporter ATP-binding protein [Actinoallomurus iriomotensis]|uniref:Multidrug ABC transporter permease n=1 Tax=Actinoallomurus iriomotensis TaxID=478107 RepID=A0A9W6S410_9ACTN|nr:ABC transporter ATP-binding protein [Actinoallomurus iriomotensis]GLY85347.1 multidrug ABC transporter permease [Actinoallomurus iriomotensis]